MNKIKYLIGFLIMLTIMSCSTSVGYINDGVEKYSPTTASSVKVYSEKKEDQKYIEIGYVAAHMTSDVSGDGLKILIKEKAAAMGADAVVSFKLWGSKNGGLAEGIAIKYVN